MQTFVFTLSNKRRGQQTNDLLVAHVNHLKRLKASGSLVICGPYSDNDGAIQIIRSSSIAEAKILFEADPFIQEGYYQNYDVRELLVASDENNWLVDSDQTKLNLKE